MDKNNRIFFVGLLFLMAFTYSSVVKATYPEKLILKAEKQAIKTLGQHEITKVPVRINPAEHYYSDVDTVFRMINNSGRLIGYLILSSALGRFEVFDYMVVYNEDLSMANLNILVYRSEHGYQVAAKGWLKQFLDQPVESVFAYGQNIDAISGATISGKSFTENINRLNTLIHSIPE